MSAPLLAPSELAAAERNGSELEKRLVVALRHVMNHVVEAEILNAHLRSVLLDAANVLAGEKPPTEDDIYDFVERAREIAGNATGATAYKAMAIMSAALTLAAEPKKPREYYVELAREAINLPAKDGSARALARIDIGRVSAEAAAMLDGSLFAKRFLPELEPHLSHHWNGSNNMCVQCGIDIADDDAARPCTGKREQHPTHLWGNDLRVTEGPVRVACTHCDVEPEAAKAAEPCPKAPAQEETP